MLMITVLSADYSTALTVLLRYPPPHPHSPSTFVRDALYLEQDPSPGRGRFIISKYSGRSPGQTAHHRITSSGLKIPLRRGSRDVGNNVAASSSANSGGPKNLETFLQDVSEGIQRRAGAWGVAKAVRGAVNEAKKNMQSVHVEKGGTRFPAAGHASTAEQPAHDAQGDSGQKIEQMEERNRLLARKLANALSDLHQSLMNSDTPEGHANTNTPTREAISKVESVQSCLRDSSIPVYTLSHTQTPADELPSEGREDREEQPPRKKDVPEPKAKSTGDALSASSSSANLSDGRAHGFPARPTPRASLADSEFSWMVEGSRQLSEFVDSSVTPERARQQHNSKTSKQAAPLFGGGEDNQPGAEFDEMAMNSLRAPKSRK